jgi:hypothetical protein
MACEDKQSPRRDFTGRRRLTVLITGVVLWGVVVWSAVFSHAPASFRNAPVIGR